MRLGRLLNLTFLLLLVPGFAVAESLATALQPIGINRYSAAVAFEDLETEKLYLIDTGAAYSLVPLETIRLLQRSDAATPVGDDLMRAVDGRTFRAEKYRLREMTVGGCLIKDEVVYASPASRGILGMNTLARVSPITLDVSAQTFSLNCLAG
jgi:hypothetical protein